MRLIDEERETYETMFAVEPYGVVSPGADLVPLFVEMTGHATGDSVLDAGCGTGKGAVALAEAGYRVKLADLTPAGLVPEAQGFPFTPICLWHDLRPLGFTDWGFCCDVLEHLPPEYTMLAVHRLLQITRKAVFLSIALVPDQMGVWVGRPLHLTVQPFTWWRDHLADLGSLRDARDLQQQGVYLVAP